MVPGVLVASTVGHPYIIPPIGNHETWCPTFIIDEPGVRAIDKSMHEDDGLQAFLDGGSFPLHSEHGENVSVLGDHSMGFNGVSEVFAVIHNLQFSFRVFGL